MNSVLQCLCWLLQADQYREYAVIWTGLCVLLSFVTKEHAESATIHVSGHTVGHANTARAEIIGIMKCLAAVLRSSRYHQCSKHSAAHRV
jgi:hypothetical protein